MARINEVVALATVVLAVALAGRVDAQTPALLNAVIDGSATVDQLVAATAAQCNCAPPGQTTGRDAGVPSVNVGTASGAAGQQVTVAVRLSTASQSVAGVQDDIAFDVINAPIAATLAGEPDCQVNPNIDKEATAFAFEPPACVGAACTAVRAIVLSFHNVDPIPDGSLLYVCKVDISPGGAVASYPLTISNVAMSTPGGQPITSTGMDGAIIVTPQDNGYNCYKSKDLKTPQFAGSTLTVTDEFGTQAGEVVKKPYLYCTKIGSSPNQILSCYKVKSRGFAAGANRAVTDSFGNVNVSVKKKSSVFCVPGTSW